MPRLPALTTNTSDGSNYLLRIEEQFKKILSTCPSIEYTVERGKEQTSSYARMTWKQAGDSYWLDFLSGNGSPGDGFHKTQSFDGKRSYWLIEPSTQVLVKDGPMELGMLKMLQSPLIMYSFLRYGAEPFTLSTLKAGAPLWNTLSQRISFVGKQQINNKLCFALRVADGFAQDALKPADYDVYFDIVSLLPIAWKAYDKQGYIIEECETIESKNAIDEASHISLNYPVRYMITQYQWVGKISGPDGPVKFYKSVREGTFKDVKVGGINPEDLQLDVTTGDSVYDLTSKTLINIPK